MQAHTDRRFADATWLALGYRMATLLTAIAGPTPGGPTRQTQLSKGTRHGLLLSIDNR